MPLTAGDVIVRAQDTIQDENGIKWPVPELLRYLNDGRREIAIVRPDLYTVGQVHTLAAGTVQTIPDDGQRFVGAVCNIASGGAHGRAVTIARREWLDKQRPAWHTDTPAAEARHYMVDDQNPRTFYNFPPVVAGAKMLINYVRSPVEIGETQLATSLAQEDIYCGALVDYICHRAFSKDAEYAGNAERAAKHLGAFAATLGIGRKVALGTSPNQTMVGGSPPRAAA